MYTHPREKKWKSLPATIVGVILVLFLFGVLPFANHVSFKRLQSSGGFSAVPTSPPPSVDVVKANAAMTVFQEEGDLPALPVAETPADAEKLEIRPVTVPHLDPYVVSTRKTNAFVFNVADLDAPPIPIHRVAPVYPPGLRMQDIEGKVMVEFRVNESGVVVGATVLDESHAEFGKSVVEAVMRWKFLPGTVGGESVKFRVRLPVAFRIDGIASSERNVFQLVTKRSGDHR